MKKNRKGFTLIELLAVIVVLGLIMTIAGTAILKQKKKANIEEALKIEQSIKDLGPNIYSYEYLLGNKSMDIITGESIENNTGKSKDYSNFICKESNFYCIYKKIDNPMGTCLDDSIWNKDTNFCVQKSIKYNGKYYRTDRFAITISELADKGYLKNVVTKSGKKYINSPFGKGYCDGYLRITRTNDGPRFKAFIKCGSNGSFNDYKTPDYEYVIPGGDNTKPGMFTATIKDSSN